MQTRTLSPWLLPALLFLLLLTPTTRAAGEAPQPQQVGIEACDFYRDWLEVQVPCGSEGYALAYGRHYCRKFMSRIDRFSDRGQIWVRGAMLCLQGSLRGYLAENPQPGCETLKRAAFDSHPECYTSGEVSFCELKARDYWQLGRILSVKDTFTRLGLRQIAQVARICLMMRRSLSGIRADEENLDSMRALEALVELGSRGGELPRGPEEFLDVSAP